MRFLRMRKNDNKLPHPEEARKAISKDEDQLA